MPEDWLSVVLRFALHLDLMILFGVPLFSIYALGPADRASARTSVVSRRNSRLAQASAVAGVVLSLWDIVAMAESMTGATTYTTLTGHVFNMILTGTAVGTAWMVRMVALATCLAMAVAWRRRADRKRIGLAAVGAIALATLAWSGHGAMDDGLRGTFHLVIDIAHLLAAGMWVGALVAFVLLSSARCADTAGAVQTLSRAASGFATIGTGIVGVLIATGVANYAFVVGPTLDTFATPYGWLLLGKLMLFAGMLVLAAGNRYRLSPRLAAAIRMGDYASAVRALRNSLRAEACVAVVILALVAWLGVLSPLPS
ncbi:copper homeostasis membrane protein CopD [Ralstonia soli]|uniref:Copper homeostasis membrane protein CopD n=1 Tax=Ralstonia soli TaxID=2953896 RepID=A0ABT1AGF2_9RALS|nr:copper homeostasis membrane protein CopD [Ralstonia soli]MCO5397431.1 copper homeostasis membrane protein CopD [Ralstonia soli]